MSDLYYRPKVFERFAEVRAALSLRDPALPGGFSMLSTNCSEEEAVANRECMTRDLGFSPEQLAIAWLQHDDQVLDVTEQYEPDSWPKVDGLVTDHADHLISVTVADCVGVLAYDPTTGALAAIHSGWRGSLANIAAKTIARLQEAYGVKPANLYVYVSPAPRQDEYETSAEIAAQFDAQYSRPSRHGHAWFDNQAVVVDQLLKAGVDKSQMEVDKRSTISDLSLHSHRRDAKAAGRMMLSIGRRD